MKKLLLIFFTFLSLQIFAQDQKIEFCKGEKIDVSKSNWISLQSWNHYILPIKNGKKKFRDKKINYILGEENSSDWWDLFG